MKPLGKRTAPTRRSGKDRRSSYFEDKPYIAWLHTRSCGIARILRFRGIDPGPCCEKIDADHRSEGSGTSQRSPDPLAAAICHDHHMARHQYRLVFSHDWDRERMRDLIDECIAYDNRAWYGRALVTADLILVREFAESGRSTRGMFGSGGVLPADAF